MVKLASQDIAFLYNVHTSDTFLSLLVSAREIIRNGALVSPLHKDDTSPEGTERSQVAETLLYFGLLWQTHRACHAGLHHSLLPAYEHWNYAQGSTNSVTFLWCDFCYNFQKQTMKDGYDILKVSWCSFLLLTWHCSPELLVLLVTAWLPLPEQDNVGLPHSGRCLVQKHHYSYCTGAILFSSKHLLWFHPSCTAGVR